MFLNFFSKTEAGHVLKMFLQFWLISASRSYKLGSYKKKRVKISKYKRHYSLQPFPKSIAIFAFFPQFTFVLKF